jgi:hypothetical protein
MVLSNDVSYDASTDGEKESDGDYLERTEGDSESAEDATWDDYCCNEVDVTGSYGGKDMTKWVKVNGSTHIRRRWKNILTKLQGSLVKQSTPLRHSKRGTVSLQILSNTIHHSNQYILIFKLNFSRESCARITKKREIKAFIGLLCLVGTLWINK